jgi:hypothetical protein
MCEACSVFAEEMEILQVKKQRHRVASLSQQHNKSFNLTSPALRGERRSGAVKRAPQVNSNPLCCKHRPRSWCELSTKKKWVFGFAAILLGKMLFRIGIFSFLFVGLYQVWWFKVLV